MTVIKVQNVILRRSETVIPMADDFGLDPESAICKDLAEIDYLT